MFEKLVWKYFRSEFIVVTLRKIDCQGLTDMPKFSQESFSKLSTCHNDLQVLFYEVIKSFDCVILEGYRSQEDHEKNHSICGANLNLPHAKHNRQPSMSVDACPYFSQIKTANGMYWFAGYVMGIAQKLKDDGKMEHAIRFGGDYKSDIDKEKFKNLVHFELIE